MNKIKKILFSFITFLFLIINVNASSSKVHDYIQGLKAGDTFEISNFDGTWKVTYASTPDSKTCNLDNPDEVWIKEANVNYESTFGFTYENTCTDVQTKSQSFCATMKCPNDSLQESSVDNNNENNTTIAMDKEEKGEEENPNSIFISVSNEIPVSSKKYNLLLLYKDAPPQVDTTGSSSGIDSTYQGGATNIDCNQFVDYYTTVWGTYNIGWWVSATCSEFDFETHTRVERDCSHCEYGYNYVTKKASTPSDCIKSDCSEFYGLIPVPSGACVVEIAKGCEGPQLRYSGSTSVQYCAKVEPTKVEAYTYKLVLDTVDGNKETYCVNPSYSFRYDYKLNNTWKSSKCYDSLHSYNSNNELEIDLECGYVYILAEAKRINAEANKEIFDYSSIVTAMRLFGTGITSSNFIDSEENINVVDKNKIPNIREYLQNGGYYYTYKGWSEGEYIGIPSVIPVKNTSWPAVYQYWMPEFYSIYINTAKSVETYLKNNIRLSDVGKMSCDPTTDTLCSKYYDNKYYSIDATDYLNYKICSSNYKEECTVETINYQPDESDNERINSFPDVQVIYNGSNGENKSSNVSQTKPKDGTTQIEDFATTGVAQKVTCTPSSGMGVLCGNVGDSIEGAKIDISNGKPISGGKLDETNYLDAIYLYIRALQGNKIVYEDKIEKALNQYTPVKGLTKIITDEDETYVTIRFTIDNSSTYENANASCNANDAATKDNCEALIYVYDSNNNLISQSTHYDYCKKNYCYLKVEYKKICNDNENDSNLKKLHAIVVTDPNLKANVIKKIGHGGDKQQTLYVYDDTASVTGDFCQEIDAVQEDLTVKCLCDPKEKSNKVVANGNINNENVCSNNYDTFDELYYGDPSMSTILNACYEEDKLKYDYTEDLNANGNDIVHEGEQPLSKYSYQLKKDDFNVCKLYCRIESRIYIANKTAVRAGMSLKYDIGQVLMDKKIINETPSQLLTETEFKNNNYLVFKYSTYDKYVEEKKKSSNKDYSETKTSQYDEGKNFSPLITLELKECTSEFNFDKWKDLFDKASTDREKNQLIYSAYNCNLYTTADIKEIYPGIISDEQYKEGNVLSSNNSYGNNYAEPAMIEYEYSIKTGKTTITKNWGTTKDYLLAEEQKACESVNLDYSKGECGLYSIIQYEDDFFGSNSSETYLNTLGVNVEGDDKKVLKEELSLVDSNLNKTIHCSGESCYKLKDKSTGRFVYNPYANNKYDYTVVTKYGDKTESGKILSYSRWGLDYSEHSSVIDGKYKVPTNQYSSFVVVSALGYYNAVKYYSDNYTGIISRIDLKQNDDESDDKEESSTVVTDTLKKNKVQLDKNVFPLHLNIEPGTYKIETKMNNFTSSVYKRNTYYTEKNYSLIDLEKVNGETAPTSFKYICTYDVYNINEDRGDLGYTYRIVDLEDVFASVVEKGDKDTTGLTREYPENWASSFANNVREAIENSYDNILEPEGNGNSIDSYLEYSYTLTSEGIKKLRQYNDSVEKDGGYLNDTLYNCEYDSEEGIFYNCRSNFLDNVIGNYASAYSGSNLIIDNKTGALNGLTKGESEFCSDINNSNKDYCKYQFKGNISGYGVNDNTETVGEN